MDVVYIGSRLQHPWMLFIWVLGKALKVTRNARFPHLHTPLINKACDFYLLQNSVLFLFEALFRWALSTLSN